ncbi:MAG: hypothetical protein IKU34_06715 [Clostridia bacterium]|nr:hypothetical protein [Clostridia bacterium]
MSNCSNSCVSHACGCASSSCSANSCGGWCASCGSWMNRCRNGAQNSCPYSQWMHPICCNQAYYSCAGAQNGATLVIHQIALEAGGQQSCTPRSFQLRITGPSYPCGEVFSLRAGSCVELDEPLVISGLEPGQYRIEPLNSCCGDYISTITGPACGQLVTVSAGAAPTVVTIVSRRSLFHCRRCACAAW